MLRGGLGVNFKGKQSLKFRGSNMKSICLIMSVQGQQASVF